MNAKLLTVWVVAALVSGCVVAPPPQRVVYTRPPPPPVAVEYDYVGETTPIEIVEYPHVIFYPRFVVACNCITPVGFYNGIWIDRWGKTVVYEGVWHRPPVVVIERYREEVRVHPHLYRPMPVERVTIIRERMRTSPQAPVSAPLHQAPAATQKDPMATRAAPDAAAKDPMATRQPPSAPSATMGDKVKRAPAAAAKDAAAKEKAAPKPKPPPKPEAQPAHREAPKPPPKKKCPEDKKDC